MDRERCRANPKLKDLELLCREQGLPLTVQRRVILEELAGRADHPTAEQLYAAVKPRLSGVSRTTVYRVLDAFVRLGVARRIDTPDCSVRFDAEMGEHCHVHCLCCGRVADLDDPLHGQVPVPEINSQGFAITGYSIHFRGLCAECRAHGGQPATSPARRKNQ
ncbi:MAG: transcriptional repressor [Geobacter sp.]|nr:transcriptional repressor [Geobacter sp.]